MVGQRPLEAFIGVRVPVPQHSTFYFFARQRIEENSAPAEQ